MKENLFISRFWSRKAGFTLIELLVVVLIIGILAAIALPAYNRAIAKSRFRGLMVPAKAAYEGQEAYYLTEGRYAAKLKDLDISFTDANSDTYTSPNGITLAIHDGEEYSYAIASRTNYNNNVIMYQEHSKNFAGNIHCEAKADDEQANWLCEEGFHGTPLTSGSQTEGYNAYILQGSASDGEASSTTTTSGSASLLAMYAPVYTTTNTQTWNCSVVCPSIGSWKQFIQDGELASESLGTRHIAKEIKGYDEDNKVTILADYDQSGNLIYLRQPGVSKVVFDNNGDIFSISSDSIGGYSSVNYYENGNVLSARKDGTTYYYNEDGTPFTENAPDVSSLKLDTNSLEWVNEWKNK